MSYGWLTQSAILPKKSKEIKTKQSGLVGMQAAMLQLKEKMGISKNKKRDAKTQPTPSTNIKRNPGIAERMLKDEKVDKAQSGCEKNIYKHLQKKAAMYDQIMNKKANVSKILVDFEGRQSILTKKQQKQFQKDRQDFYNGKLSQISKQQKYIHENIQGQNSGINQVRQRLAWQKQVLNELKKGGQQVEQKPKVIQSFDHKMTKDEKQALDTVLEQQKSERMKLQEIRRRKQALEHERIRKIKNLNIMRKEDDQKVTPLSQNEKLL